jgi:hypothetical protein
LIDPLSKRELGSVVLDKRTGKARRAGKARAAARVTPAPLSPRQLAVFARVRELVQFRSDSNPRGCVDERDFEHPRYAREVIQEWTAWQSRTGRYHGLSELDRARLFWRALEDVCDRSSAIPGLPPWFTR